MSDSEADGLYPHGGTNRYKKNGNRPQDAKTLKGRKILESRSAECHASCKNLILMKKSKCGTIVRSVLNDIRDMKKPQSIYLSHRTQMDLNSWDNFEHAGYLCRKHHCGLFCIGGSSKKRPAQLILGRTYAGEILDQYEFSIKHHVPASAFRQIKGFCADSSPIILLQGGLWETTENLRYVRNFMADLFRGIAVSDLNPKLFVQGVDRVISIGAWNKMLEGGEDETNGGEDETNGRLETIMSIRQYRIEFQISPIMKDEQDKVTNQFSDFKLHEVGPQIDLALNRFRLPSMENWKASTKTLEKARKISLNGEKAKTKSKNIKSNVMGDVVGRVYVEKVDTHKLQGVQDRTLRKLERREKKRKLEQDGGTKS